MKKSFLAIIVIIIVLVGIYIYGRGSSGPNTNPSTGASATPVVAVVENNKLSGKASQYQNAELGFSVNYPSAWEADNTDTGVTFIMQLDKSQVSTVAKLQADISVAAGKCAFPPVTTIKDRGTLDAGSNTLNMISMTNNVQGRAYFNRMYTLQKGEICYLFSFASITLAPESQNLSGSNLTQAQNNNKAIINTADSDFTSMVKSFMFVTGPAGVDESKAAPSK